MSGDPTSSEVGGDAAPVAGRRTATSAPPETAERLQARDVVAFGHEVGRVLSDGRIVGRAEPFAKVFASSRHVKRAVGATAWVILEDIALDATIDDHGRLVADTNVRHIAANLGLNKTTVTRHVARLRDHGFVLHEEARDDASGRWHSARYVLDPSACVERFTHTPAAESPPAPSSGELDEPVDRADGTMSAFTGHGRTGHGETDRLVMHRHAVEEEQHAAAAGDDETAAALARRLCAAGVAAGVADDLVGRFPAQQVADALEVLPARRCSNAAGWLVRAISDGWQLHDEASRLRAARTRAHQRDAAARALQARQEERDRRLADWTAAVCEALTDTQLTAAVERTTRPVEGLDRRSAPVAASQLLAWAIATATAAPDTPLEAALTHALHDPTGDPDSPVVELPENIPRAPATDTDADPEAFRRRVKQAIDELEPRNAAHDPKSQGGSDAP
jgi:DNA-binding transcriptional ArsR family regulator